MKFLLALALLLIPLAIYWFVIRPRLKARLTDLYTGIDSFWARQWARIVAFRTFIIGAVAIYITTLPDLLPFLAQQDVSFMPPWVQNMIRTGALVAMMYARARATTPPGEPPAA